MLFRINQILSGLVAGFALYINITTLPWWAYILTGVITYTLVYLTIKIKIVRIPYMIIASVFDGVIIGNLIGESKHITTNSYIILWTFVIGLFALAIMSWEYNQLDEEMNDVPKKKKKITTNKKVTNNNVNTNIINSPMQPVSTETPNAHQNISMVVRNGKYVIIDEETGEELK